METPIVGQRPFDLATENARLRQLWSLPVMRSQREPCYDDLVRLAVQFCHAPIAVIELLDADRVRFKAGVGIEIADTPRLSSFCESVVALRAPLVIIDAAADPRFCNIDMVAGSTAARGFLGFPLELSGGAVLGSLSVIDTRRRHWTKGDVEAVGSLARQVVAQIELASAIRDNTELQFRINALETQLHREREESLRAYQSFYENGVCQDLAGLLYMLQAALREQGPTAMIEQLAAVREFMREMLGRYASVPKQFRVTSNPGRTGG